MVDKENYDPLAERLKAPRREAEKVVKDSGKDQQLSQREPLRDESKAPRILRR